MKKNKLILIIASVIVLTLSICLSACGKSKLIYTNIDTSDTENYGFAIANSSPIAQSNFIATANEVIASINQEEARALKEYYCKVAINNGDTTGIVRPTFTGLPTDDDFKSFDKILKVYTEPQAEPYTFRAKGNIVGYDIDLIKIIAYRMQRKVQIISTEFKDLIDKENKSGIYTESNFDTEWRVVACTLSITEQRKQVNDLTFTDSYETVKQAISAYQNKKITGISDLAGKKVGILEESTGGDYIRALVDSGELKDKKVVVKGYNFSNQLWSALESGEVDAIVLDNVLCDGYTQAING